MMSKQKRISITVRKREFQSVCLAVEYRQKIPISFIFTLRFSLLSESTDGPNNPREIGFQLLLIFHSLDNEYCYLNSNKEIV